MDPTSEAIASNQGGQIVEGPRLSAYERRPVRLCVVLPALNEEATIRQVIEAIPRELDGIDDVRVVVIDDGSRDRTREWAEEAGADVVSHTTTKGVGLAFKEGVRYALEMNADFMVNMDADGQFDPRDIPKLLEPLLTGKADFVTASRFKDDALEPCDMGFARRYGNKAMSRLISTLCGSRFYDVSCGFRAYSKDTLLRLNLFGSFTYTQETFLDLCYKGVCVEEIPVACRGRREFGTSRVAPNLFYYAINTSKIIFRTFRDYRPVWVFGGLAMVLMGTAFALFTFLLIHYLVVGTFSPHKWAGFTGGFLGIMGFLTFVTAMVADMLARIRMNQEHILYLMRRHGLD